MTDAPLDGIVVADFSRVLAGPLSTMVLADLGATVIKVEHPEGGDDTRVWGPPFVGDDAAYFLGVNRNKRSLTLDLTDPDDVELARRLIARSDVLVENFRPGVMERFGLGYERPAGGRPGFGVLQRDRLPLRRGAGRRGLRPVDAGAVGLHVDHG